MTVRPASHDLASCTLNLSLEGFDTVGNRHPSMILVVLIHNYGKLFTHWRRLKMLPGGGFPALAPRWCNWNAPRCRGCPAGRTTDYDEATM